LRFEFFQSQSDVRLKPIFVLLCLLSITGNGVLNSGSADAATRRRLKSTSNAILAPSSQGSETVLKLSSPYSGNLSSAGISAGIRLLSPQSKTLQIQSVPHPVFGWSPQRNSGASFLRKLDTPPALPASPKSSEPLFLDAVSILQDGDYLTARLKFQDSLRLCKTATESLALAKELTSLELYGLARSAFLQAELQDETLKDQSREWQRLYFPSKLLTAEKETLFATALYDERKSALERYVLLGQLSKAAADFSPVWRHLGLLQIQETLKSPNRVLPISFSSLELEEDKIPLRGVNSTGITKGLKNLKRASSLSPGSFAELEAWGDGAALGENFPLAIEVYTLAQANLPKNSETDLWGTLEGKKKQAEGSLAIQKSGPSASAYRMIANGLQLQNRPIEYFQALYEAKNIENKGSKF